MTDQQVWDRQTQQETPQQETPQQTQQQTPRKTRSDLGGLRPHTKKPNYKARGPRPHTWIVKDEFAHKQYVAWLQHRNQAQWRQEPYELTFENYQTVWGDNWIHKGRNREHYCLTRQDPDLPWDLTNTVCMPRSDAIRHQVKITRQRKKRAS